MGLRLHATADLTTVTHRPATHWLLGAMFVAGGSLAVALSLGLANNAAQQTASTRAIAVLTGVRVMLSPVAEHYGPPEVARTLAADLGLPAPA